MRFVGLRFHPDGQWSQSQTLNSFATTVGVQFWYAPTQISSRSMVAVEVVGSRWPGQKRTRAGINARQLGTMVVTAPREPRGIYRTDHRRGKKVGINGGRVQYENKTLLKKPPLADPTLRCPGNEKCCQQQNLYGASALRISQCYRVDRARIEPFLRHIHWSFLCRPML